MRGGRILSFHGLSVMTGVLAGSNRRTRFAPEHHMSKANPQVDGFLRKTKHWRAELAELRKIALGCDLTEEIKWGHPCYTLNGRNVVLIHGFKDYCAMLFIKGVLLKDPHHLLIQQTENVQAGRQIRFTDAEQITKLRPILKAYILEAVEVEKAGTTIDRSVARKFELPAELKERLDQSPELKKAFQALTPGRQRGYALYFSSAKQAKTRQARVDKCVPRILQGKGLDD